MDVTLGVAVEGADARVVLLGAGSSREAIDKSHVNLSESPVDSIVSILTSTDRLLRDSGHRLVATNVCSSDETVANSVCDALTNRGLTKVNAVSQVDAVAAVTRLLAGTDTAASLAGDSDTLALSIVDTAAEVTSLIAVESVVNGDREAAYSALLERLGEELGGATRVVLLDASLSQLSVQSLEQVSPVPLTLVDDPEFAIARGAALIAEYPKPVDSFPADSLDMAVTMQGPQVQQLAYSEVGDSAGLELSADPVPMQVPMQPLRADCYRETEYQESEVEEDSGASAGRPRVLLLGSSAAAVAVVGFAALAVTVAINIRPTVREQPIRLAEETVAGKYFPVTPGQGEKPDGPNWTMIEEVPPAGTDPVARTFRPQSLNATPGETSATLVKYFRDGTIGVVPAADPIAANAGLPAPAGFPDIPEYLTRLIPDFSRWTPSEVLALVGNMGAMAQSAGGGITSAAAAAAANTRVEAAGGAGNGPNLSDVGVVAVVPATKGSLFSTSDAATGAAATDVSAIPAEIFKASNPQQATAEVLPSDTKVVDAEVLEPLASAAGGADKSVQVSIPVLGQVISPEVTRELPGTAGNLPVTEPGSNLPEQASPPPQLPSVPLPAGSTPKPTVSPSAVDAPAVPPKDIPSIAPPKVDPPEVARPGVEVPPVLDLPVSPPKVEAPPPPPPVLPRLPAAPPVVDVPPVLDLPVSPPKVEAPPPPPPVLPQLPVAPPAPIIDIPELPLPSMAPDAPKLTLPTLTLPTLTLPTLPPTS